MGSIRINISTVLVTLLVMVSTLQPFGGGAAAAAAADQVNKILNSNNQIFNLVINYLRKGKKEKKKSTAKR